jgi:hypothetical protein
MITEERAKQFQILYQKETGKTLPLEEAFRCAEGLVEIVRLVYRPIKKSDYQKFDNPGKCSII